MLNRQNYAQTEVLRAAYAVIAILFAWTLLFPASVEAQDSRWDGQIIREIEYRGLHALPPDTMDYYLLGRDAASEERRLDTLQLNDRIKRLWNRELIDDIDIEVEPVVGGVKLIVEVRERPLLTSIEYVGIKRVNRSDINEQIDRERIQVYESQPLQLGEIERLKYAIEDLYKEKGYRFARVSYVFEEVTPSQQRVTFTIDEGTKVKIGDINFDGNTVFGDWRLRQAMKKTKESGMLSRFTKKDIYNPAGLDEDLDSLRNVYRKAGYKDVIFGEPELAVTAKNPNAPTLEDQKRRLVLTIPVEEGERWRFGDILVEGSEVFNELIIKAQFEQPRGGWLRSKVIDDGLENLDKLYKSIGYIFARVDTDLVERDNYVADLLLTVDERDQFKVGRMEFVGNTKTRDKVLRREMFVQEGTVMNMNGIQSSLLRIRQLNYFTVDEEEPVEFDFDSEEKLVNLQVKGQEAERTELQFGGGWSEFDGFFGQFSMRTTNFRGRGETVGVSVQAGGRRQLYNLEYRVPWFLDKAQNIGINLFSQEVDSTVLTGVNFRQAYSGLALSWGRSFKGFNNITFTYSFSDVEDNQTRFLTPCDPDDIVTNPNGCGGLPLPTDCSMSDDPNCEPLAPVPVEREFNFTSSSIRPTWSRNTLDSRFEPTRGLFTTASVEIAGGALGGETDYIRPTAELTWFRPISRRPFKSSFGFHIEGGFIESLSDDQAGVGGRDSLGLFPQQRFFTGGEASIRGFRTRTIVARNEDGTIREDPAAPGFPVGGTKLFFANLEYHIMVGGPFRFVLYGDGGGVFDDDQDISTDLMRFSAGAELRIQVPLFPAPLRFIYAYNIDPLPNERFNSFDFALTTSF